MKNTALKISVLMPAYNVENYIEEAVQSILNQSFKDFELIILEDSSTDNTWEIMQKFPEMDNRISVYKNDENLGISKSRNKLIKLAKAKYIAWQDADDISLPERLEHQFEYMENNPDIGISGGYLEFFDSNNNTSIRKYSSEDSVLRKKIFRYSPVAQGTAIIRREVFEITGYFPGISPVAEDLAMSFLIGTKYKFGNLHEVILRYRQNENSVTFKNLKVNELFTIFLRYRFGKHPAYKMLFTDKIYNLLQHFSIFLIPTKIKIIIFNFLRNS